MIMNFILELFHSSIKKNIFNKNYLLSMFNETVGLLKIIKSEKLNKKKGLMER
jgi:hypothetical protein